MLPLPRCHTKWSLAMPKGIFPNERRYRKYQMPFLQERVKSGWRLRWLALAYGCHPTLVSSRLKTLGLRCQAGSYQGSQGSANASWKGGKAKSGKYVYVLCPDHPHATKAGRVLEHRLVMEKHLGRYLLPTEVVHHKEGYSNELSNLVLFQTNGEHLAETLKGKCPDWTADGKRRISEGVLRSAARHKKPIPDKS